MKTTDFEALSQGMIQRIYKVLFSKRAEYANDKDCLENFKQPTTLMGANPAEVCVWYDTKHFASMVKMAKDANQGKLPSIELLQEKVGDYLSYGLLYYACMVEMMAEQELNTEPSLSETSQKEPISTAPEQSATGPVPTTPPNPPAPFPSSEVFPLPLPDQPVDGEQPKNEKRFGSWRKK